MQRLILLTTLSFIALFSTAQTLTLRHMVQFDYVTNSLGDVGSSDCWGWTASDGTEYAIIGNHNNVSFVRASDGMKLDSIVAPDQFDGYYHRDMVTLGDYCYCVAEMFGTNQGLMIMDLSTLPDSVTYVGTFTDNGNLDASHNMDVDVVTNHIYVQDGGGVNIYDVNNPESPVKVGYIAIPALHDIHARGDTLWAAEGWAAAFSMYDVSDKSNPVLMGRVQDPSFGYAHNIWPSDDGKFFISTEETSNKTTKIYDVSDMNNWVLRGQYLGSNALAHNAHVMGDLIFFSHYSSGVTVVDWSDKDMPVEIAAYDTYPQSDISDFYGCWGAWPYSQDGTVYASNFEGRLFILDWDALGVGIEEEIVKDRSLPYPSVFSEVTNIPFTLDGSARVRIEVRDLEGRVVSSLVDAELNAGSYVKTWRPDVGLAAGVYMVRVSVDEDVTVHRVVRQ